MPKAEANYLSHLLLHFIKDKALFPEGEIKPK